MLLQISVVKKHGSAASDRAAIVYGETAAGAARKATAALEKFVGTVNNISENPEQPSYAVEKFKAEFKDSMPIPVLASFVGPYDFSAEPDELKSSQFWDVKNGTELMNACKYSVSAFSMRGG